MKKTILLILTIVTLKVSAQNVNIPDANFKAYLVGNTTINTNSDTEIQTFEASAFIGIIDCSNLSISDLTGIEAFTALTGLWCSYNSLTALDVSINTALTSLYCNYNSLTALDVSNNTALTSLWCSNNSLTALDVSNNTALTSFWCSNNSLTALDVSNNTALIWFWCSYNSLTALDVSNNTALTELYCGVNSLTSLDVSNNTNLTEFHCGDNSLTALDVSNNTNLTEFHCFSNSLTALDVSNNTDLIILECGSNSLTALDVSINTALTSLICLSNSLTALNVANGNNTNFSYFNATYNPNLSCIQVDDVAYSTANWGNIDATASFSTNCTASVNEIAHLNLTTFPNPTTGNVTFSTTKQIGTIEIYNLIGQKVAKFTNTNTIDISSLSKGIYTAKATSNSKIGVVKLIKE